MCCLFVYFVCFFARKSKYSQTRDDGLITNMAGFLQLFKANDDRNSEFKHILVDGILAKYLRFFPKTHHNSICMRTEVFGVRLEPGRHAFVTFISSLCCIVEVFVSKIMRSSRQLL